MSTTLSRSIKEPHVSSASNEAEIWLTPEILGSTQVKTRDLSQAPRHLVIILNMHISGMLAFLHWNNSSVRWVKRALSSAFVFFLYWIHDKVLGNLTHLLLLQFSDLQKWSFSVLQSPARGQLVWGCHLFPAGMPIHPAGPSDFKTCVLPTLLDSLLGLPVAFAMYHFCVPWTIEEILRVWVDCLKPPS